MKPLRRRADVTASTAKRPEAVRTSPDERLQLVPECGTAFELPAPPAVPPSLTCSPGSAGGRGRRLPRTSPGQRRSWAARGPAPRRRSRTRPPRPPLAVTCRAQPSRCPFGERGPACACAAPGTRMAAASCPALEGRWGHRLGGDRAEWLGFHDRDEDSNVRRAPPGPRARAGWVAWSLSAEVVPSRRASGPVRGSRDWSGALRERCAGGFDRPARPRAVGVREQRGPRSVDGATRTVGGVERRR